MSVSHEMSITDIYGSVVDRYHIIYGIYCPTMFHGYWFSISCLI